MLGLLEDIWHGILDIPYLVIGFLITYVVNPLIAAIGALLSLALSLLPPFPAAPSAPDSGVLSWLLWFVPLGTMLTFFGLMVTAWIAFLAVKVALKWGRAL